MRAAGFVLALLLIPGIGADAATAGSEDSGSVAGRPFGLGTGLTLNTGYFFQETMFYSRGRGGLHMSLGKVWRLPRGFGVWTGVGGFRSAGTVQTGGCDGCRFETDFASDVGYVDAGIVTPWLPLPICVALYRHSTRIDNRGIEGAVTGLSLSGDESGIGWGFNVHVLLEYFFSDREPGTRGLAIVIGYIGFLDQSRFDIVTRDGAGNTATLTKWRPLRGESLQLGIEYEF